MIEFLEMFRPGPVVTASQMQEIDKITIEKYGIPGTVLMERVGLAVTKRIESLFPSGRIVVVCGGGNNGGDGLVVARNLHNAGREVEVYITSPYKRLKGDARINFEIAKKFKLKIYPARKFLSLDPDHLKDSLVVDAIFGTGLSKEVRSPISRIIKKINTEAKSVISIDIPSGISSDTGQIMGCAVKADYTVTFGLPKIGHYLHPGAEYTGQLFIEDIGFPRVLLDSDRFNIRIVRDRDIRPLIPVRHVRSYKGTYGHVLIVAGSTGKTGAALMAAKACLRTGAGLVTIGVPQSLIGSFETRVTEEMLLPLPDDNEGRISKKAVDVILSFLRDRATVLAIGPGISVTDEIRKLMEIIIVKSPRPIVIDADGLNAIAHKTNLLKKASAPIIITPHPGEMVRLLGSEHRAQDVRYTVQDIEQDRINMAISFARSTKTHLVLKGVPTVTATPAGEAFLNTTGNPGMATAGSGDVLTGIIAGLLAQGLKPDEASVAGVFIHGLSGDLAFRAKGQHALIASDIIESIPSALKLLSNN